MLSSEKQTATHSRSRSYLKPTAGISPPRAKFKRVVHKAKHIYGNIDDAFNVLSLTDSLTHAIVHQSTTQPTSKFDATLSLFQNHFWLASKIVILSKMFYLCTHMGKDSVKDNVATYTVILFGLIFITQNFV